MLLKCDKKRPGELGKREEKDMRGLRFSEETSGDVAHVGFF
jgi:hypothetical protein